MARDLEEHLRPEIKITPFCAGCGHGILMGLILRAVDALGLDWREILFVSGIGCAAWIPSPHFKADTLHTLHGRAIPFATGAKLANPKLTTIVVSGDGDLTSIGGNHLIHAARRNIDMTVICANNMIYGMTGGQLASTTPVGMKTATSLGGNPYRPFDLQALVKAAGAVYSCRYAVAQPLAVIDGIKKAIGVKGFSFVEVLSSCPAQYGRRNSLESPAAILEMLRKQCVRKEDLDRVDPEKLKDLIVTGEFVNGDV